MGTWKHVGIRLVAATVIVAFTGMVTAPAAAALREGFDPPPESGGQYAPSDAERLAAAVVEARDELRKLAGRPDPENRVAALSERREARERLKALRAQIRALDDDTRAEFDRVGRLIAERNLPPIIAARHAEAVAEYDARARALADDLAAIETAPEHEAFERAGAAFDRLELLELERPHQPFDPDNLPNRSLQPVEGLTPKTTAEEFVTLDELLDLDQAFAANDYDLSGLAGAQDAAYLAPTPEVLLSDAVKAKAEELGHDPLAIFNWVRNHVQWQPAWGAVQNADLTLSAGRGTAQDIASLTIALLRASGIPARYVHGTIEVDEARFRNWVGGFEHLNAAIHFAASGGIPVAGVHEGGRITRVRMQHVWVEAALDFFPSRGAVNRAADSWVPFDPSFKQYEFLTGLDPVAIGGLDPEAIANAFLASGTVNEQEGWVTGFDPAILANAQQAAAQALEDHIATHLPDATVGDVLGGRRIIEREEGGFAGTLENPIVVVGARHASLPDGLRQHIRFGLGTEHSVRFRWADVNNQRITLSFRPATTADEQALLSLLPEGPITDISQLPGSIPAYLVRVRPELKVGDQVVMTGDAMNLGHEVTFTYRPELAGGRIGAPNPYKVIAGSYLAVSAIAGNVAPSALEASRERIEATRAILESGDPGQFEGLTREDLLGDLFHVGLLGYYGQYTALAYVAGLRQGGHHYLGAGLGTFGFEPNVHTVLGMPMAINRGSVVMNIPILNMFGFDQDGSLDGRQQRVNFVLQVGALSSALEHAVPERMFVANETPGEAISAMRALQKASAAGQRIYHVTPTNQAQVLPQIQHNSLVMNEIRNMLNAGREVITHTSAVSVPGWSGAGYIIFDPATGDGAYKIGGGLSGGALTLLNFSVVIIGLLTEFKAALLLERLHRDLVNRFFLNYLVLISAVLDIIKLNTQCAGASGFDRALANIGMVGTYWFAIASLALLPLGPVLLVGVGLVYSLVLPAFVDRFVRPICE